MRADPKLRALFAATLSCALLVAACSAPSAEGPLGGSTVPGDREDWTRQFVIDFMEAREDGDEAAARLFLSPTAAGQFAAAAGSLTLTGDGDGLDEWALLAVEAADASSFEVRVRVEQATGEAWEELIFVGVGPGPDGVDRDMTIRGVERLPVPG